MNKLCGVWILFTVEVAKNEARKLNISKLKPKMLKTFVLLDVLFRIQTQQEIRQ